MGYLDAIFYLMWHVSLLLREPAGHPGSARASQQKYLKAQSSVPPVENAAPEAPRKAGIIAVSDEDLPDLGRPSRWSSPAEIGSRSPRPSRHPHHQTPALPGVLRVLFAAHLRAATGGPRYINWSNIITNWPNQPGEICLTIVDYQHKI